MKFGFIAKHRGIGPTAWLCEALGVSRGGVYAWLTRPPSERACRDEALGAKIRGSFLQSDRTYGARRVWHDLLTEGEACGLHRIERLMQRQGLRARPRRRRVPADAGTCSSSTVSPNVLGEVLELLEKWEGCILTGLNVWRRSNHPNKEHPPWQEYRAARAHARG